MDKEPGDEYLRRLATFIRSNEKSLAEAGVTRRRRAQRPPAEAPSVFNPLGWLGLEATAQSPSPPPKPVVLSLDTHHLFYILMRIEALGIDIGTLDVEVESPSRPMSYISFPGSDKSDTLSLSSFRSSFSAVSALSLGSGWWGRSEPPSVETELKYIYSSFTKLPALSVNAPGRKVIAELANESPNSNALPMDAFKNLQSLECVDIDPRALLGWDRLAESLKSLRIKKSGLEDVSDIFIGAVVDDQARREGSTSRKRRRMIPHGPIGETPFYGTRLPDTVTEDPEAEDASASAVDETPILSPSSPPPSLQLSSSKWAFLKHLSLSDNALTFFPVESIPYLSSLTHLDLSSNLLVSVPSGLSSLYNLVSLNLSDNMIDSVLGIYQNLGQVLHLNLSNNRLESICGLERLMALERIDLRQNFIEESSEIGRLATLPNISEVWVEGNPFVELEEGYRISCFDYFWKEGKSITLDGTPPTFYEKRNLTVSPSPQMSSSRPVSTAYSPPIVAVGPHSHSHSHPHPNPRADSFVAVDAKHTPPTSSAPSRNASPLLTPVGAVGVGGRARRKKNKRIVELDGEHSDGGSSRSASHTRTRSDGSTKLRVKPRSKKDGSPPQNLPPKVWRQFAQIVDKNPAPKDEVPAAVNLNDFDPAIPKTTAPEEIASSSTPQTISTNTTARPARSRHSRRQTEFTPSSYSNFNAIPDSTSQSTSPVQPPSRSMTLMSKSAARRARVSASVYEPPASTSDREEPIEHIKDNADAYRKRVEALRKDMGEGWLKVFSQSQMAGTGVASG